MTIGRLSPLKTFYDSRNPMLVVLLHQSPRFFKRYFWHHFKHSIVRDSMAFLKRGRFSLAAAAWRGFSSGILWGLKNKKITLEHIL
jgi:hypothetical protein